MFKNKRQKLTKLTTFDMQEHFETLWPTLQVAIQNPLFSAV